VSRRTCSRLAWVTAVVVALAAAPAFAGSSSGVGVPVVSGTFAGKADGTEAGVVVTAEKAAAAGQARRISVYICNGTSLSVLLTGAVTGNLADLRSADGRFGVHVELTPQAASGKLGVLGGGGFRFSVPGAPGLAGLFDVGVTANGLVRGVSPTGGSLSGRVTTAGRLTGSGVVKAAVSSGGRVVQLTASTRHLTPGAYRWIVLPDRTVYGANKGGLRLGGIGGVVRPAVDKHVRIAAGSAGQEGYDDKKCGELADRWNKLVGIGSRAFARGDTQTQKAANAEADKTYVEMSDHCLVVEPNIG